MKRAVVIPVFPDFQILDVTGPAAVLEVAGHFSNDGNYDVRVLSVTGGPIASSCGLALESRRLPPDTPVDTLLVPGGSGARSARLDPGVVEEVRRLAAGCRRVTSVCTGAFVLARAGLLDGRKATTHWRHAGELARHHPAVRVIPDCIWVNDGRLWTSAGVCAGIDLALALVADDLGPEVARRTAREVVVHYQRPGGQSQFSSVEEITDHRGRFRPLLASIRANPAAPSRVEDLAARMAMSPRNFSRRFREDVGMTPGDAVALIRVEAARALVESTRLPIDRIARTTGFGDPENMRRTFQRLLGQSPRALRTAARAR